MSFRACASQQAVPLEEKVPWERGAFALTNVPDSIWRCEQGACALGMPVKQNTFAWASRGGVQGTAGPPPIHLH